MFHVPIFTETRQFDGQLWEPEDHNDEQDNHFISLSDVLTLDARKFCQIWLCKKNKAKFACVYCKKFICGKYTFTVHVICKR